MPDPREIPTRIRAQADAATTALNAALPHLTETLTDPHRDPRPWQDCTREDICEGDLVETLSGDILRIGVAHYRDEDGDWWTKGNSPLTWDDFWPLRRIPVHTTAVRTTGTTEEETRVTEGTTPAEPLARTLLAVPKGHGEPHYTAKKIATGDYVLQVDADGFIRAGRAHHQDEHGDWRTEDNVRVTWAARCADRLDAVNVQAAEEVEMPTKHPAHLLDVVVANGDVCPYMALDRDGYWTGVSTDGVPVSRNLRHIAAATLPGGTRARRDGNRPDGTPRFVKIGQ